MQKAASFNNKTINILCTWLQVQNAHKYNAPFGVFLDEDGEKSNNAFLSLKQL